METDWRKEFFDNFKIYNETTRNKAREIILANMKEQLFSYRSIATKEKIDYIIEQIEDETLYLAHPLRFNDPFDCSLGVQEKNSSSLITADLLKMNFEKLNLPIHDTERLNFVSEFLRDRLDASPSQKEFFDKMYEENIKKNRKVIGESNRIHCFTEKNKNM